MSEEPRVYEAEEKKETSHLVSVNLLASQQKTALVQYEDGGNQYRTYVPKKLISADSKVELNVLKKGMRHGLPWDEVKLPTVSGDQLAAELHKHNVWTAEDFRSNPNGVRAAINQLYGKPLAILTTFIREQSSKS